MGDPKGFLTTPRETPKRRPVDLRLMDWREVYEDFPHATLEKQAGRCMNCGIPFCHQGCPLGNLIPEWNDLVHRKDWREKLKEAGYWCGQAGKWHLGANVRDRFDVIHDKTKAVPDAKTGDDGSGCTQWVSTIQERPKDKPFFLWLASSR